MRLNKQSSIFLFFYYITMSFVLYALAFIIVIMGGPALFVPHKFMKVVGWMAKNSDVIRMISLRTMFLAFFFLAMYPLLKGGRLMLISILGWLMLIKSVIGLWFPALMMKQVEMFYKNKMWTIVMGIVSIVFAAFLVWAGMAKF